MNYIGFSYALLMEHHHLSRLGHLPWDSGNKIYLGLRAIRTNPTPPDPTVQRLHRYSTPTFSFHCCRVALCRSYSALVGNRRNRPCIRQGMQSLLHAFSSTQSQPDTETITLRRSKRLRTRPTTSWAPLSWRLASTVAPGA